MRAKIIYHLGPELSLRTKAQAGVLFLENGSLTIRGASSLSIAYKDIINVDMFRMHGLGRMLKLQCRGGIVYLTPVRLNLFGYFVIINFFLAGRLYKELQKVVSMHGTTAEERLQA